MSSAASAKRSAADTDADPAPRLPKRGCTYPKHSAFETGRTEQEEADVALDLTETRFTFDEWLTLFLTLAGVDADGFGAPVRHPLWPTFSEPVPSSDALVKLWGRGRYLVVFPYKVDGGIKWPVSVPGMVTALVMDQEGGVPRDMIGKMEEYARSHPGFTRFHMMAVAATPPVVPNLVSETTYEWTKWLPEHIADAMDEYAAEDVPTDVMDSLTATERKHLCVMRMLGMMYQHMFKMTKEGKRATMLANFLFDRPEPVHEMCVAYTQWCDLFRMQPMFTACAEYKA